VSDLSHEIHEVPLVDRIIEAEIRSWRNTTLGTAAAAFGSSTPEERGGQKAIEQIRYLHQSGPAYSVVPRIVGALRRAGLLREQPEDGAR
jgi:hypothetical protein